MEREQKIIEFYAEENKGYFMDKNNLTDLLTGFLETLECDHMCTSNCRGDGCNCDCGEYHIN